MEMQSGAKIVAHVGFLGKMNSYTGSEYVNTFRAAWFWQFLQKK